jgi:hypothetical protein
MNHPERDVSPLVHLKRPSLLHCLDPQLIGREV